MENFYACSMSIKYLCSLFTNESVYIFLKFICSFVFKLLFLAHLGYFILKQVYEKLLFVYFNEIIPILSIVFTYFATLFLGLYKPCT